MTISKSLSPTTVTENGQITYTFIIQNLGNTATAADNVAITDTFNPILNPISVSFNGTAWNATDNYTYNNLTGAFATVLSHMGKENPEMTEPTRLQKIKASARKHPLLMSRSAFFWPLHGLCYIQ